MKVVDSALIWGKSCHEAAKWASGSWTIMFVNWYAAGSQLKPQQMEVVLEISGITCFQAGTWL
jgi:hypothetical protein